LALSTTAFTYDAGDRPPQITDSVGGTIAARPSGSDLRNHLISRNNVL
jgi:hypothetical protein